MSHSSGSWPETHSAFTRVEDRKFEEVSIYRGRGRVKRTKEEW